jgi:hypothetical protein
MSHQVSHHHFYGHSTTFMGCFMAAISPVQLAARELVKGSQMEFFLISATGWI